VFKILIGVSKNAKFNALSAKKALKIAAQKVISQKLEHSVIKVENIIFLK
jgi:hypothetical protein